MKSKKIAVTGKGGSGKTAITAILTGLLAKEGKLKILAIDADSSVSLSYALGIAVNKTVSEIRRDIIEDPNIRQEIESRHIREAMADIVQEGKGFDLLTMGRPEGPGCFCATNDLLRYGIDSLSRQYDITLIDCEAGPEQVNRRVVNGVDFLLIVTDTSLRGMHAAMAIDDVVRRETNSTRTGLIINKSTGNDRKIMGMAEHAGLDIVGSVPVDHTLSEFDSLGKPIIDLPENSPGVQAVREVMGQMEASLLSSLS